MDIHKNARLTPLGREGMDFTINAQPSPFYGASASTKALLS